MKETTLIQLIKPLEVTDLSGEKVMIDFSSGKYFLLKGSANEIWDFLVAHQEGITVSNLISSLVGIYEVDYDICKQSVTHFLQHLESLQFISCTDESITK